MNRALPEMFHSLNTSGTDVTVLERQRACMKWRHDQLQLQQQQQGCYDGSEYDSLSSVLIQASRVEDFQDLMASGWPDLGKYEMPSLESESSGLVIPRTLTSPPAAATMEVKGKETTRSAAARENSKKRKASKELKTKQGAEAESKDKRVKLSEEDEESKVTEQNSTKSRVTSNHDSKASEVQKTDYIQVRARRGQATDSHSLAERARREKISERMKYLQSLVPGCNKVIGKAGMLDEIINYVQSLQQQVEFLSMKLGALNPRLDYNVDDLFAKQVFPTIEMSSEMANSSYLDQLGAVEQMVSCCLSGMGTTSPVSVPETLMINSASFTQQFQPSSTWGTDLQSLYDMNFEEGWPSPNFLSQQYPGSIETSNQMMEM